MNSFCKFFFPSFLLIGMASLPATSQTSNEVSAPVPSRVLTAVDDTRLVKLQGNIHPMARPEFDLGRIDSQLFLDRVVLVLKRSPAQEAALEKFMEEQNDPESANFHRWLEPEQFGSLYGPSDSDLFAITSWLQNQGLVVTSVNKGRTFVEFSGTAALVQRAFHTEIHKFRLNGVNHIANSTDPSIPEALTPVVEGVLSLNDFFAKPMHRDLGNFKRNPLNGKWIPENPNVGTKPLYTTSSDNGQFELVSPYDFATIYNVLPLWSAGIDGTNQTIAIAGRSDIKISDVRAFRAAFGLPAKDPVIIVNGADPGIPTAGDVVENTLDVEWSGAVAKKATIKYVTTKSTATTDGASSSAIYIIDHKVAPVMSFSYGNCELAYGTAGNAANNSLWQQAAAQGITAFVASGDQGAAACDGGQQAPYGAEKGLAVSGASTTPYNVAVGGTDLNWANSTKTYWNAGNASNGLSAKSYMPEVPWNGTCASNAVDQLIGGTANGWDAETTCEQILLLYQQQGPSYFTQFLNVVGGTGGKSTCTKPSGSTPATCSGGYAKPSWQTGTGVPADGKRDVPDVSLFASGGSLNTAYAICDTAQGPCTYSNPSSALMQAVGGTSVASPALAGIMALVNQKMGSAQGNANVAFYKLAAKDNRAACASTKVAAGNTCNFYDVTTDNIAVPCIPGTPNCTLHHSGDSVGILSGYSSTTGYDYSTGLGTVNATNLVNNWASVAGTTAVSVTPTSFAFPSTTVNTTSGTKGTVTVKNTGTKALSISTIAFSGTNASSFSQTTACPLGSTLAAGTSCTVTMSFRPTATGALSATLSVVDGAGTQTVKVTGTGNSTGLIATTTSLTSTPNPSVSGQAVTFTATVKAASGATPTGTVSFMHSTTLLGTGTLTNGVAKFTTSTLAAATLSITAIYAAHSPDAGSTSPVLKQVVLIPTTTTLTSSPNPSVVGKIVTFTAKVKANAGTPAGTVNFMHSTTLLGTGTLIGGVATFATSALPQATLSITAVYPANSTDAGSTSPVLKQVVNK